MISRNILYACREHSSAPMRFRPAKEWSSRRSVEVYVKSSTESRERNRETSDGGGKRVSGHKLGCRLRFLFSHFSSPHLLFLLQSFPGALSVSSQQTSDSNWIPYDSGSWIYVDTERARHSPSLNSSGISRWKACRCFDWCRSMRYKWIRRSRVFNVRIAHQRAFTRKYLTMTPLRSSVKTFQIINRFVSEPCLRSGERRRRGMKKS